MSSGDVALLKEVDIGKRAVGTGLSVKSLHHSGTISRL